jgi:ketosteroid isomerase-like protein
VAITNGWPRANPDIEGETMGNARTVMDRVTAAAMEQHDINAVKQCYAENAVVTTPDAGEVRGRDRIADYWRTFIESFPDARWESLDRHESGNHAIDEGYFVGTNTMPLRMPNGDTVPATGKRVKIRGCDIATVTDDRITEHHLYFDQMEFMSQLGLAPPSLS